MNQEPVTMFSQNLSTTDLWDLETLSILDPETKSSKKEEEISVNEYSLNTVSQESDGRYTVRLPLLEYHAPLPSNYNLLKKRLENLMKKLDKGGYYNECDKVLK